MIPFSGLMQVGSGVPPVSGGRTAGQANGMPELPDANGEIPTSGDNAGSFPSWVQKVMDDQAPAEPGTADVSDPQGGDGESETHELQSLIAQAMEQSAQAQHASQPLNAESSDNGKCPASARGIDGIPSHNDGGQGAGTPVRQGLSFSPEMAAPAEQSSDVRQSQTSANGQPFQANAPGALAGTGQGDELQAKVNPSGPAIQGETPIKGLEKEKTPVPFEPVSQADGGGKQGTDRLVQQQIFPGQGISNKTMDPASTPQSTGAGPAGEPESAAAAITGGKTDPSREDPGNSRERGRHHQAPRLELADNKENEVQKCQAPEPAKISDPGLGKAHPSFQETAKAMSVDPSTGATDRKTVGQATAPAPAGESGSKTFQTTVMDQIVDKAAIRSIHGRSEIQIRLKPEFLGNVQMNVATDKDQMVVRIAAEQTVVKDIIETHIHHLKAELQSQGLAVDKIEVMVSGDADHHQGRGQSSQMFKNNSFQNGRRQPREQNPGRWDNGGGNEPGAGGPERDGVNFFA